MNNSFNEQLRAMLSGAGSDPGAVPGAVPPSPGISAQGGAQPGDEMTMRAYRLYSAEAQKNGDQVVPFEEFRAAVMAQQQQQAQQAGQQVQQMPPQAVQMPPGGLGTGGGLR